MASRSGIRSLMGRAGRTSVHGTARRRERRFNLERLEDRLTPATITLTSLADTGVGTLRAAITTANLDAAQDTIVIPTSLYSVGGLFGGYDLRLTAWSTDGSSVPTSGKNLVVVGQSSDGQFNIRIFDANGASRDYNSAAQLAAFPDRGPMINLLSQQLPSLLPPHVLTGAEKAMVKSEVGTIVGKVLSGTIASTITVDSPLPSITSPVTIIGQPGTFPFPPTFTISGGTTSQIFQVAPTGSLALGTLTVARGFTTDNGGGIVNQGVLSLDHVTVTDCTAANGGGIYSSGSLMLMTNSTISNNTARGANANGGGIYSSGSTVVIINSTISNNTARGADAPASPTGQTVGGSATGGGISITNGLATIGYTSITGNLALGGKGSDGGPVAATQPGYKSPAPQQQNGRTGRAGADGIAGGHGGQAYGGGIAFDSGTSLGVSNSLISENVVRGGSGGAGSNGGNGGDGEDGGDQDRDVYSISPAGDGGAGGAGGKGGDGGTGAMGWGGGIYLGVSALDVSLSSMTIADNDAVGGVGGRGGSGGSGGRGGRGGNGSGAVYAGLGGRGGNGGDGGAAGAGGLAFGGGIFNASQNTRLVQSSTIAFNDVSVSAPSLAGSGGMGGVHGASGAPRTDQNDDGSAGNAGVVPAQSSGSGGGGIGVIDVAMPNGFNFTLQNTIVAANTRNGVTPSDILGTLNAPGNSINNLIGSGGSGGLTSADGNNQVGVADPGLDPLADNGGPTRTLALRLSSPAVNAGDDGAVQAANLNYDQRGVGFDRIQDGRVDIGAYEMYASYVVTTLNDEDDGTTNPNVGQGTSLREAIALASVRSNRNVTFAPALFSDGTSKTITLTLGQLVIAGSMNVVGPGAALLTINADQKSRVFYVDDGTLNQASVGISGLTVTGGLVSQNNYGGGILTFEKLSMNGMNIIANDATDGGGVAASGSGAISIEDSAFVNNTADIYGGGIFSNSKLTSIRVSNTTFADNSAKFGYGIADYINGVGGGSGIEIINVTMKSNRQYGIFHNNSSPLKVSNSIIVSDDDSIRSLISPTFLGTNLIQGMTGVAGVISADPLLGPLQDNGGPTPTMALKFGSPALDAGDDGAAEAAYLRYDQRGFGFDRIQGSRVDLGAYESRQQPPSLSVDQTAVSVNEYQLVTNTGKFDSIDGRARVTLTASLGTVTKNDAAGTWSWSYSGPPSSGHVVITATDNAGWTTTAGFTLTVAKLPPQISIVYLFDDDSPVGSGYHQGDVGYFGVEADDRDQPYADLIYKWTITLPDGSKEFLDGYYVPYLFPVQGDYLISVDVTNAYGLTASWNYEIITPPNPYGTNPITVAGPNLSAAITNSGPVRPGTPVTVSLTGASDPSGGHSAAGFHYSFGLSPFLESRTGVPSDMAIGYADAGTSSSATFTFDARGTYTVYGKIYDYDGRNTTFSTQVVVNGYDPATTTEVTAISGPAVYGAPLTLRAKVVSESTAYGVAATGMVQFVVDGANVGGLVPLIGGVAASAPISGLAAGPHTVSASFQGDADYSPSTATSVALNVAKASLTVTADDQEMGRGDAVPTLTYRISGFVNGDDASAVAGAPSLSTSASSSSLAGSYPITVAPGSLTASNYDLLNLVSGSLTVHPKVTDVRVVWGTRSTSVLGLDRDLPFSTIKAIDVIFSDDVAVHAADLALVSTLTAGKTYATSGFSYDAASHTARWSLPNALDLDKLRLTLDGDAAGNDGVHAAGGIDLGAFSTAFSVLPGDFNGDGGVDARDLVGTRNGLLGVLDEAMAIWADLDGDGKLDINDYIIVKKYVGKRF